MSQFIRRSRAAATGGVWIPVAMAVLATIFAAVPTHAQSGGTIEGTITAAETGAPLSGVTVHIPGTALGAVTDVMGRFRIAGVPAGSHSLVAERLGRELQRMTVQVGGGRTDVRFRLTEEAILLPDLVISTTREAQRLSQTSSTVGVLTQEALQQAKPSHPADVMGRIPGVWVSVTGGEGHMTSIRQPRTTNPVYLFLENGVPTRSTGFFNHNALYEVNVPQADRIEVLKGPATALYGSDAIGGVVNVESRGPTLTPTGEAYVETSALRTTPDSPWMLNNTRLLLSGSNAFGSNGIRGDLNVTRVEGWRDGTAYDRQSGTLRWDRQFAGGTSMRTLLSASRIDQQTAGSSSLLKDDYETSPQLNYTPISLRNVRAVRLSSAIEKPQGKTLWSFTPYMRWNEMELLPNWSLTYDPTIYTTGHSSLGTLVRVRHDLEPIATRLIAGLDVDYSPGSRVEDRVVAQREGQFFTSYTRGDPLYDYDVTFHSVSPYVQAESSPMGGLHLSLGLRYDRMGYDYTTRLPELQTGNWRRPADTEVSFERLSPKLGATYDFGRALNVYGNYNRGFRVPSEGQLFRQGAAANTVGLRAITADSYEAGVRGELFGRIGYTAAAYRMEVDNDVLTFINTDGTRETQNAGATRHRGVEAGVGLALGQGVRADISYSRATHEYLHWQPRSNVDYSGHAMEAAPRTLANARLSYSPTMLHGATAAVEWSRIGSYWMDPENTHRYGGHNLLNAQATVPVWGPIELNARVTNLLDKRYAEGASYTAFRGEEYAPGQPRAVFVGAQYRWRGGPQ